MASIRKSDLIDSTNFPGILNELVELVRPCSRGALRGSRGGNGDGVAVYRVVIYDVVVIPPGA